MITSVIGGVARKHSTRCDVAVISLLTTNNEHVILSQNHDHMHLPDPEKYLELKLKENLKEKTNQSLDTPAQIIQRCIQEVPSTSPPHMPKKDAMRKLIQRVRNKHLPSIPKSIHDIAIPAEFTITDSGEQFLVGHFIENKDCVMAFSTKQNLKLLNDATFWMMDGTFNCCPRPFCQIYTIHAIVGAPEGNHKILPLVYGLLSTKTQRCYSIFLEMVKTSGISKLNTCLRPDIILTDFEIAAMNAIKKAFPNCVNKLCFFFT